MIYPVKKSNPLGLYFVFSIAIHLIFFSFFHFFTPKQKTYIQKSILVKVTTIGDNNISDPLPISSPPKKTPALKKSFDKPILQKPTNKAFEKKTLPVKPVPTNIPQKNIQTPTSTKPLSPMKAQEIKKTKPDLASDLDKLLDASSFKPSTIDQLSDATWAGKPRKAIFFPDLSSSIPFHYQSKGYGFSVTAKITFNPQGWVSAVELLHSSGDSFIDSIFRTELRKIQIESSMNNLYETIVKTFTISVK